MDKSGFDSLYSRALQKEERPTKPILCLDFDGVIHSYASGWQGADVVTDPPVPGAIQWLKLAILVFDVQIFSSRSNHEGGIEAMRGWLSKWEEKECDSGVLVSAVSFPKEKPPAHVTLDDRAITFTGRWPYLSDLVAFKPWYT